MFFDFFGKNRRTQEFLSLKTKSSFGGLREKWAWAFQLNVQTKRMSGQTCKSRLLYWPKSEPSARGTINITKSNRLTCQKGTVAINISANFIFQVRKRGKWKDNWWDCSKKFPHWSSNKKTWGQMFTQNFDHMTWQNSSRSCTRGSATCTTWLLR